MRVRKQSQHKPKPVYYQQAIFSAREVQPSLRLQCSYATVEGEVNVSFTFTCFVPSSSPRGRLHRFGRHVSTATEAPETSTPLAAKASSSRHV
jgi:hypothetical protein